MNNVPFAGGREGRYSRLMDRHCLMTAGDYLADSPIAGVLKRGQVLEKVESVLLPLFPAAVAANVRVCNYEAGVVVLLVASPVWKAKLRMIKPDLMRKAELAGLVVHDVEVRTVRALPVVEDRAPAAAVGSPTARKALSEAIRLLESGD